MAKRKTAKVIRKETSSVELLWGEKGLPKRGPKPTLSVPAIARAAVGIADAEGLATLSMQRLAHELGVTTMALYRYIPGKVELLDLMIEFGSPSAPDLRRLRGWRPKLEEWTRQCWAIYRRHPWFREAMGSRRWSKSEENGNRRTKKLWKIGV